MRSKVRKKIKNWKIGSKNSGGWLLAACCLLLAASSCTPLFVPPVRASLDAPEILDLAGSNGLRLRGNRLELSLQLNTVPEEGWLAVQWYSPENALVASDSKWIENADTGFALTYGLPSTELSVGDWRAVVSFEDAFIRQFGLTITQ